MSEIEGRSIPRVGLLMPDSSVDISNVDGSFDLTHPYTIYDCWWWCLSGVLCPSVESTRDGKTCRSTYSCLYTAVCSSYKIHDAVNTLLLLLVCTYMCFRHMYMIHRTNSSWRIFYCMPALLSFSPYGSFQYWVSVGHSLQRCVGVSNKTACTHVCSC